jgi:dihydropyrimidinase
VLVVRGGTVVTAEAGPVAADVLVDGERVVTVGEVGEVPDALVVVAARCLVVPGGVDAHTHLDSPQSGTVSTDDFHTGTVAAAFGGTTTIVDFAVQGPGTTLQDTLATWAGKADGRAVVDYGFHVIVTSLGEAELGAVDELLGEGVTSLKLFMASPLMVDDATIYRVLERRAPAAGWRASMPRTAP